MNTTGMTSLMTLNNIFTLCALDEGRLKRNVLKKVKSDTEDEKLESCRKKNLRTNIETVRKLYTETTEQLSKQR